MSLIETFTWPISCKPCCLIYSCYFIWFSFFWFFCFAEFVPSFECWVVLGWWSFLQIPKVFRIGTRAISRWTIGWSAFWHLVPRFAPELGSGLPGLVVGWVDFDNEATLYKRDSGLFGLLGIMECKTVASTWLNAYGKESARNISSESFFGPHQLAISGKFRLVKYHELVIRLYMYI